MTDYRRINAISELKVVLDSAKSTLKDIEEGLEVTEALFVRIDVLHDVATMLTDQHAAELTREAREARETEK